MRNQKILKAKNQDKIKEIYEKYITILENNPSVKIGETYKSIRDVVEKAGLGAFKMYLKVIEIRPLEDYKLWCRLMTGETKIYDFTPHLDYGIYQILKDKSIFNTVSCPSGVPAWINEETGLEIDIGISWILIDGVDVVE